MAQTESTENLSPHKQDNCEPLQTRKTFTTRIILTTWQMITHPSMILKITHLRIQKIIRVMQIVPTCRLILKLPGETEQQEQKSITSITTHGVISTITGVISIPFMIRFGVIMALG